MSVKAHLGGGHPAGAHGRSSPSSNPTTVRSAVDAQLGAWASAQAFDGVPEGHQPVQPSFGVKRMRPAAVPVGQGWRTRPQARHCSTRSFMARLLIPARWARSVRRSPSRRRWRHVQVGCGDPCLRQPGWQRQRRPRAAAHQGQHALSTPARQVQPSGRGGIWAPAFVGRGGVGSGQIGFIVSKLTKNGRFDQLHRP